MKISTRIFLGFAIILILFFIVTLINIKLSEDVNKNTEFLRKSADIIRMSNALQRNIADLENGLSSYLLQGEESYYESYVLNERQLDSLYNELANLLKDQDYQKGRLSEIKRLLEEWKVTYAVPFIILKRDAISSSDGSKKFNKKLREEIKQDNGKNISNEIRLNFKEINSYEYKQRKERQQRLKDSVHRTSFISGASIFLAIIFGFVAALITTRMISLRINKMVSAADRISKGDFKIFIEDTSKDELKELSNSLNIMAVKLDQSFTEVNQFAHIVSHDLKAPLRGIENVIRWMEEDKPELNGEIKKYIDLIKNRAKRMENFIEGILELSRIDKISTDIVYVNVEQIVADVIDLLNLPNTTTIHIDKLPSMQAERIYLHQVFLNLLSNAIKYNDKPSGNIWITYKTVGDFYMFSVKDDGPGIDPEFHNKIFQMFQTLQERDAFESTGIGLSIVKKIIERKHGYIKVNSSLGHGAEFIFTWPQKVNSIKEASYNI